MLLLQNWKSNYASKTVRNFLAHSVVSDNFLLFLLDTPVSEKIVVFPVWCGEVCVKNGYVVVLMLLDAFELLKYAFLNRVVVLRVFPIISPLDKESCT